MHEVAWNGDKVFDARIYVDKIYTYEDEQEIDALKQMKLGPDEVAFEVRYELKPTEGTNVTELSIFNSSKLLKHFILKGYLL